MARAYLFFDFAALALNFSTRPAVSITFSSPVKNGWQALQTSTSILSIVEPTLKLFPQAQVTVVSLYSGCISFFIPYVIGRARTTVVISKIYYY